MTSTAITEEILHVLDGVDFSQGSINTPDEVLIKNIKHSIRLGHPQVRPQAPQKDRICLVGGGPSLDDTFEELRQLYFEGAKVVTVNGSAEWCLDHNIRPSAHIVLDARPENARFVARDILQCRYMLASQCHPATWKAVEGRDDVWIWHAMADDNPNRGVLDEYYQGWWVGTPGGTTVVMRALLVLRMLGFMRFDLFGVDSCFMGNKHHAYEQAENEGDSAFVVKMWPGEHTEKTRSFVCAPWMMKQLECFLQTIRIGGHTFLLNVHGDGLLAYALRSSADVQWSIDAGVVGAHAADLGA